MHLYCIPSYGKEVVLRHDIAFRSKEFARKVLQILLTVVLFRQAKEPWLLILKKGGVYHGTKHARSCA